jgi:hypothetical protein
MNTSARTTRTTTDTKPTEPLSMPPGYSLDTAQLVSFLVDVAVNMGASAPPSWTPVNACDCTQTYSVSDFTFSAPISSTFVYTNAFGQQKTATETFAFTAVDQKTGVAYLIFRGSQTDADFLVDAETDLVDYTVPPAPAGAQVEKGFYAVYNGMVDALTTALKNLGQVQLVIGGHSLGSAVATLSVPLAISLGLKGFQYNQASPKVGNSTFATYLEGTSFPTYRLVNMYDVVPTTPLNSSYVPVGAQATFGADYGSVQNNHNPCCTYSYAIFNPTSPFNKNFDSCSGSSP